MRRLWPKPGDRGRRRTRRGPSRKTVRDPSERWPRRGAKTSPSSSFVILAGVAVGGAILMALFHIAPFREDAILGDPRCAVGNRFLPDGGCPDLAAVANHRNGRG